MAKDTNILKILDNSPSIALLRARRCNLIIEFLTGTFEDITATSYENIHSQLADFLNDHGVEIDEENDILYSDTFEDIAAKFIRKWTDNGFLANYRNEDGEIYYE